MVSVDGKGSIFDLPEPTWAEDSKVTTERMQYRSLQLPRCGVLQLLCTSSTRFAAMVHVDFGLISFTGGITVACVGKCFAETAAVTSNQFLGWVWLTL
jgi:hypothetical protein